MRKTIVGVVITVDHFSKSGVIKTKQGKEYYFGFHEWLYSRNPRCGDVVIFERDMDWKHTNVAINVEHDLFKRAG